MFDDVSDEDLLDRAFVYLGLYPSRAEVNPYVTAWSSRVSDDEALRREWSGE